VVVIIILGGIGSLRGVVIGAFAVQYVSLTLRFPLSRSRYMRLLRLRAKLLTGARATVEAVLQDPQREDTAWLRMHQHVEPPRGEPYDVTWWETWRLTPERDRIRVRSLVAFVDCAR
jgi:hypothetical protein